MQCEPIKEDNLKKQDLEAVMSIKNFKKLNSSEQVNYFNKLNENSKISFLAEFLPGSDFNWPPNETIRFLKNGKIIIYSGRDNNPKGFAFFVAHWKVQNNSIIAWKDKKDVPFPAENKETWVNFIANKSSQGDLYFEYKVKMDSETEDALFYEKNGADDFIANPEILEKLSK